MASMAFPVLIFTLLILNALTLSYGVDVEVYGWDKIIFIRPDGSIDPPDAPIVTYDNVTYKFTADIIFTSILGGMVVERDGVIIDGCGYTLTTTAERGTCGTLVLGRRDVTIRNVVFKDHYGGVIVDRSVNCTIENNIFLTNEYGVDAGDSFNLTIIKNSFIDNDAAIFILRSFVTVSDNKISNTIWPNVFGGIWIPDSVYNSTIARNIIAYNDVALFICESDNNMVFGNVVVNNGAGIEVDSCTGNMIFENFVANNGYGITTSSRFRKCYNNRIYHNNIVDNYWQTWIPPWFPSFDVWDDGYPSGGNYWSDYKGADNYSGPYQNESGSDGIGDTPYVIDANNRDRYPLMDPWVPHINAMVDVDPKTLNLMGRGGWVTAYIELPENHNVADIDVSTVMLNRVVPAELGHIAFGDYDGDGVQDLTVYFNRTQIINHILSTGMRSGNFTLTITGKLYDGTPFKGNTIIKVSSLMGDVNCDGKVNIHDIVMACVAYNSKEGEPKWNPNANIAPPWNRIDIYDIVTITYHYGKRYP